MIKLDIDARGGFAEHSEVARPVDHGATSESPPRSVFDDDLVIYARTSGPRLPITSVVGLARQFRRALMAAADQPVAEIISGHLADGSPSQTPHLAILPLPAMTHPQSDGTLLGVALALPRSAGWSRRAVMQALARLEQRSENVRSTILLLGHAGELVLRRLRLGDPCAALQPRTWTRLSTRWASVTPVALDRNPGDLHAADPGTRAIAFEAARSSIIESARRIGLPAPLEVRVTRSRVLPGSALPQRYPRFASRARGVARVLVHVQLCFPERVRGPVLLGAGRYQGLGLCVPVGRAWTSQG